MNLKPNKSILLWIDQSNLNEKEGLNKREHDKAESQKERNINKTIIASMIGNSLEWFEYCIYGHFAGMIALNFLPKNHWSNIMIWIIFASGFVIRPLGGIILGIIGDKYGRKSVLTISILAMALPTLGIGLLPTYERIGILAPLLLFLFRLIQGFSLGGEFSSCIIYLAESCQKSNRGLVGSLSFVSMCFGILIGLSSYFMIFKFLLEDEIFSWGWRIPFVCGVGMGLVGMYMRSHLKESKVFEQMKLNRQTVENPVKYAFSLFRKKLLLGMLLYMVVTSNFYMFGVYFSSFLKESFNLQPQISNLILSLGLVTMSVTMPISGHLSDKFGRKKIMIIGLLSTIGVTCLYSLLLNDITNILLLQIGICISLGIYMGPIPATLVEIFPTNIRFTCVGLSYNISAALFGGTIPIISTYFIHHLGYANWIWFYLLTLDIVGLIALANYQESYKIDL